MINPQPWLKKAAAAFSDVAAAEVNVTAERTKLDRLGVLETSEKQEREELRALEDEDEALRQLDGDVTRPPDRSRAKRLAQLDKSVPGRAAAIRLQRQRITIAEAGLRDARGALAAPTLHAIGEMQAESSEAIRRILVQLAPPLAKLVATDRIRQSLLGDRFTLPEGCPPPFGGHQVARALTSAVADWIRPPELADCLIIEAADALSSNIIAQVKGQ